MPSVFSRVRSLRRSPDIEFSEAPVPPAPDYREGRAWFAWPGRESLARSVPPGFSRCDEAKALADAFYIHPTTYLRNDLWNAPYDVRAHLDDDVQRFQMTAFNGSCRLYAPRYRQASLAAQGRSVDGAVEIAYGDVLRAFDLYVSQHNAGRPFVLASHSQGTLHALRLIQDRIAGTELAQRVVAVYAVGGFVPIDVAKIGMPLGNAPAQTGCIVGWNTFGLRARFLPPLYRPRVYWNGAYRETHAMRNACVNPLVWRSGVDAPASANLGALPAERGQPATRAAIPGLTGAACRGERCEIDIPREHRDGFTDLLSQFGSYHVFDYNLFYANIRANVAERIAAFVRG